MRTTMPRRSTYISPTGSRSSVMKARSTRRLATAEAAGEVQGAGSGEGRVGGGKGRGEEGVKRGGEAGRECD